ncbi:MAG: hypothetical protein AAF500_08265 [Myxococcota bacterium]
MSATLGVWGIAAALLWVHTRSYPVLTYDDAFISLRYTQRLLEGHGLTWTDGPPVEGYSNLLWVLGCAGLTFLGVSLIATPVVLGLVSAVAALGAVVVAFAPATWRDTLPAFTGSMFLALSGPVALWAVSGLEGCLVAALLGWALVLLRPLAAGTDDPGRAWGAGVLLALLCLTRPDGPLFTAVACVFLVGYLRTWGALRQAARVALIPAVAVLGQVAFRWNYYGDWLPNTARAKLALTATRASSGLTCLADAASASYALWIPAALAIVVAWRDPKRRPRIALVGSLLVAWTGYAATVGCEPYGFRMLIPTFVLLAFLVSEVADWLEHQGARGRLLGWIVALAALALFSATQRAEPNIVIARQKRPPTTERAAALGRTLATGFGDDDPLLAVDAAGAIPYHSGFRALDMLGLNDEHIGRNHDDSFGTGLQGHELGDGDYVLSQEPDLIVSGTLGTGGLRYAGGRQMRGDPRFTDGYQRVLLEADDGVPFRFYTFVRVEGSAGVRRESGSVAVPGVLFARGKGTVGALNGEGAFETVFEGPTSATVEHVALQAGAWTASAAGDGTFLLSVRNEGTGRTVSSADGTVRFSLTEPDLVSVMVVADAPARLTEVRLSAGND